MANKRIGSRAIKGLVDNTVRETIWFATGEVTEVRTSDRRVRVKILPEEIETNWIRIIWPLTGQDYGIYVLPEVGSEIGLLFVGAETNFAFGFGNLNDDDDEIPEALDEWEFLLKPKYGGFIKINSEGIEINSDQKVVVNCDNVHLGDETGDSPVLTADSFLPKYNSDMLALSLHMNYIAPDASLATIGNATGAAHGAVKVQAH